MCFPWPALFQCCFPSYGPTKTSYSNFSIIIENIDEQEESALLSLPEDPLREIAKNFSILQLSVFSQVNKKCFKITQYEHLPSIPLIKLIALKIQDIPNRTFDDVYDINVYSQFSVKINNMNDIVISNDNPLSLKQHIPLKDVDFKFTRNLIADEVGPLHFIILNEITVFFELESIKLTEINPKLSPGTKESISRAISLVKPTIAKK